MQKMLQGGGNRVCSTGTGIITGNNTDDIYEIEGTVVNGATPGVVTLQWAQNTANASNTIVYAGSYVQALRTSGSSSVVQAFTQGGNSMAAAGDLGTNDNFDLNLRTGGTTKLTVTTAGNLTFAQGANRTLSVAQATTGTGNNLTVTAGQGAASNGTGGVLTLQGGAAGGTNQNGGNLTIDGGAATGTGIKGNVILQGAGGNVGVGDSTPAGLFTVGSGDKFQIDASGDVTTAAGENLVISTGTTGTLTIDTGTTGAVNIGNNANAKAITLGNAQSATTIAINAGGYNLNIANTGVGINATAPTTGSVDLFFGQGANRMINVNQASSGAGNNLTIAAGQSNTGVVNGGDLMLQGGATGGTGTTGSVIVKANATNSATAFQVQQANGTALLTADTTNKLIKVGAGTPTLTSAASGGLYVANSIELGSGGVLRVGDTTNAVSFNDTGVSGGAAGKLRYSGTARNTKTQTFGAEYAGGVLTGDGTNNTGTMTSDFCSGTGKLNIFPAICAVATDEYNYYSWTAQATNDYDIYVRYRLPDDFDGFASDSSIKMSAWRSTSTEKVELALFNAAGAQCGITTEINSLNTTWQELALTGSETADANCNITNMAPGSMITFRVRMTVGTNNNFARASTISFDYFSKF